MSPSKLRQLFHGTLYLGTRETTFDPEKPPVGGWLAAKTISEHTGQLGLIIGTICQGLKLPSIQSIHWWNISESCGCFTKTIIIKFETWLADWVIFRLAWLEHRKSSHLDSGHQNWAPLPWCIFITKYSYQHVVVSQSFSSFSYQNGHNMMVSSIFPDYWATRALVCCSMWWAYSWQLLWPWHHSKPRPEGLEWKVIFQLSSSQRYILLCISIYIYAYINIY